MSHDHPTPDADRAVRRAFAAGIALNVAFVVIEGAFGVVGHSSALLADAAHNLSDVLGLAMAWAAFRLARVEPWEGHTYGLRRATILAALANAVLLVAAIGAVAWDAIGRFGDAHPVQGATMAMVAGAGVVVNGLSALLFRGQGGHDVNIRGALLHLVADAAVSAGVVVAGGIVFFTGWGWVDPLTSLLVSGVVLFGTFGLLRQGVHLAMDGVPDGVDMARVRASLAALPA